MDQRFDPWVGRSYSSGGIFGKRIMALGESHYCDRGCSDCGIVRHLECQHFTEKVVREYLDLDNEREGWMSTYLKFERSLVGRETSHDDSLRIWDSLLFYNYLQYAMHTPRQAGTPEQYRSSSQAFFSVLERYRPELILVWGVRLWDNLPNERWIDGDSIVIDGYDVRNGYYTLESGCRVPVLCLYHPSSGYDWLWWNKVINTKLF